MEDPQHQKNETGQDSLARPPEDELSLDLQPQKFISSELKQDDNLLTRKGLLTLQSRVQVNITHHLKNQEKNNLMIKYNELVQVSELSAEGLK